MQDRIYRTQAAQNTSNFVVMGRDGESGTQEYIQEEKKTFMSKQAYTPHKIQKLTKRKLQTWIS